MRIFAHVKAILVSVQYKFIYIIGPPWKRSFVHKPLYLCGLFLHWNIH